MNGKQLSCSNGNLETLAVVQLKFIEAIDLLNSLSAVHQGLLNQESFISGHCGGKTRPETIKEIFFL
jgi:hypothetical protein